MILNLIRYAYTPDETLGLLKFPVLENGKAAHALWTVEGPWRDNQPFVSCIPDGSYSIQAFDSADHPDCWVITPVENRTGILIHPGNQVADVCGCIAPGMTRTDVKVWNSADACRLLNYVLNRNEPHQIVIGPGLGAIMPRHEGNGHNDG